MKITAIPSTSGSLTGWNTDNAELPAEESSTWTCIAVKETEGIEKPKFSNPNEMDMRFFRRSICQKV